MTDAHRLDVVADVPDVEDQLDYDSDLKGGDERCCPSYVPWILFGVFAVLAIVFIVLYAVAKSGANDQQRPGTAPGYVDNAIKQPKHVIFQYMTPAALKADGIDYTLETNTSNYKIDNIGTARQINKSVKGFVLNTNSDEKVLKSVMTPGYKAAYYRSALRSFALRVKYLRRDATDETKDGAKDMTIAIAYENKDILQVVYEWLSETETKKMIKNVIIYKEITAQARGCGPHAYRTFAKETEPKSSDDNFSEFVTNKKLVEKMKNVYTTAYAKRWALDAYYKACKNKETYENAHKESKAPQKQEDIKNMDKKIEDAEDEIQKQRDARRKESDYETKVAKLEAELAKLMKDLVEAYTKKKSPSTQKGAGQIVKRKS